MSSIPIHSGHWVDLTRGRFYGNYVTMTVDHANQLVAGTAVFVTFVAGAFWAIYAFTMHQLLASRPKQDLFDMQARSIYRNDSSPQAAMMDAFSMYWSWKGYSPVRPKRWPRRASAPLARSLLIFVPAFIFLAGFTAAGVLVSELASPGNQQTKVLVQDSHNLNRCGIPIYDNTGSSLHKLDLKAANDTRSAMSYSRTCYTPSTGLINSASCSIFVTPTLGYTVEAAQCPFGNLKQDFADSICAWNGNQGAFRVVTDWIDTSRHLGINSAPGDRLLFQKDLICSPLSQTNFTSSRVGYGSRNNTSVISYYYGSTEGLQEATYLYNTAAQYDNVPFELYTLYRRANQPENQNKTSWIPDPRIGRNDADVTIIFIAPNSIRYRERVMDPVFLSTYPNLEQLATNYQNHTYHPDNQTSVIGCTEQYQICTPANQCTPYTSLPFVEYNLTALSLTVAQSVTAARLVHTLSSGSVYSSINGLGSEALRMYSQVYNFISPGVPQNQWQLEVEGWMQVSMAKWQALTVEFAHNTADLGSTGALEFLTVNLSDSRAEWVRQCGAQMKANLAGYQNISVPGLVIVYLVGSILLLMSWTMQFLVLEFAHEWPDNEAASAMSWRTRQRFAWVTDGKLRAQGIAFLTGGLSGLEARSDDVPVLKTQLAGGLPFEGVIKNYEAMYCARVSGGNTSGGGSASQPPATPGSSMQTPVPLPPPVPPQATIQTTTASPSTTNPTTISTSTTQLAATAPTGTAPTLTILTASSP